MNKITRKKKSAGVLLVRPRNGTAELYLEHLSGLYWTTKDNGAWRVPKG